MRKGLGCVGCPMAMMETIDIGLKAHGFKEKEIDKVIDALNKEISKGKKKTSTNNK